MVLLTSSLEGKCGHRSSRCPLEHRHRGGFTMNRPFIAILITALSVTSRPVSAQDILISEAPNDWCCDLFVPLFSPVAWYIIAQPYGVSAGGITGAEFLQTGTPAGWFVSATANPAASLALGSPIDGIGCSIAFTSCQTGDNGFVLLYTVNAVSTSQVGETFLRITARNPPSNPAFACPTHVLCDAPTFSVVCVLGGQGIINGVGHRCSEVPCTVGVESSSWSKVKSLYD